VSSYTTTGPNANWTVIAYDQDNARQLNDSYRTMGLNDAMEVGKGYWVLHTPAG